MQQAHALSVLLERLTAFEPQGGQTDLDALNGLLPVCQNFLEAGQNFDVPASRARAHLSPRVEHLDRQALEQLQTRLGEVIDQLQNAQHEVQEELSALRQGRRGLQGYGWLEPSRRPRHVNITR
ncbi:MAG: hypothetical protein ACKO6N_09855 [Myxococcota bacterium]